MKSHEATDNLPLHSIDFSAVEEDELDDSMYEDMNLKLTERRESEIPLNHYDGSIRESQTLFHKMNMPSIGIKKP